MNLTFIIFNWISALKKWPSIDLGKKSAEVSAKLNPSTHFPRILALGANF